MDYTKGEWAVSPNDNQRGVYGIYAPNGKGRVCTITNRSPKEELANANLISAAPEMYEALKEAQHYILTHSKIKDTYHESVIMACALAKAEGR
jgi:hypothetical protein